MKKSALSLLPMQLTDWQPWLAELLPIAGIAMSPDAIEVADRLAKSAQHILGRRFEGTGTDFLATLELDANAFANLRDAAPEFFSGLNACIATVLALPYPDGSLPLIDDDEATSTIVRVCRVMHRGDTALSTRVKAVHFWLSAIQEPAIMKPQDVLAAQVQAVMRDHESAGGLLRTSWLAMVNMQKKADATPFAARLYAWGLSTPCWPTEYELPERPAWPIDQLVAVANALDGLASSFCNEIHMPLAGPRGDVTIALLERLRQLAERVHVATSRNDGLTAEILIRCAADTALQLRWLLIKDDDTLFGQFKERSYGSERDRLERVRTTLEAAGTLSDDVKRLIRSEYKKLADSSGRWPELFDVVYGPWSDISSGAMLRELPDWESDPLTTAWYSGSDAVHGSWRNLRKYATERCTNSLHFGHSVVTDSATKSAGVVPVLASFWLLVEALREVLKRYPPPADADYQAKFERAEETLRSWMVDHFDPPHGYRWHDELKG